MYENADSIVLYIMKIYFREQIRNCLRLSQLGPVNLPAGQLHVYGLVQVPPCLQGGSQMAKK